jgi:hypothetical protein
MDAASPSLTAAKDADVPVVAALMNMAFRGGGSDAGWTTEADHFQGNRTSEELLREDLAAKADAALLVWRQPDGVLLGCVWLEPEGDDNWYLGSLTIDPRQQNRGLARSETSCSGGGLGPRARRPGHQDDGCQCSRHPHCLVCASMRSPAKPSHSPTVTIGSAYPNAPICTSWCFVSP